MSTKVVALTAPASPEAEARRWIARIDAGPLSVSEREALQAWLAQSDDHARLLDAHALLWDAAGKVFQVQRASVDRGAAPRLATGLRWRTPAWGGVAVVLLAAVVLWAWPGPGREEGVPPLTVSTPVGEHRPVPLADGSRMHLNAGSKVRVAFTRDRRRVVLEAGEGLFDVARDAARPFEVLVGSTLVRAVGTRFLVRRQGSGQAEVTVFEGIVELLKAPGEAPHPAAAASQLSPWPLRLAVGQSVLEQEHGVVLRTLSLPALEHKLAWQQGRIVFDNTPLAAAIEQVNRYAATPLALEDGSLREVRVSGSFATGDIPVFLRSLEQGFGLRVERREQVWFISRGAAR